jgi:hypothetical protein
MAKLAELIERVYKESPAVVAGVNERNAVKLLRAVFATLARDIDQAPDGVYKVSGLGVFRVRTVEEKAEGKGGGRRVVFRVEKPTVRDAKTRKARAAKDQAPELGGSE